MNIEQVREKLGTNMYIKALPGESTLDVMRRANKEGWTIVGPSWADVGGLPAGQVKSLAPEFGHANLFRVSNNNGVKNWLCHAVGRQVGEGDYVFLVPVE